MSSSQQHIPGEPGDETGPDGPDQAPMHAEEFEPVGDEVNAEIARLALERDEAIINWKRSLAEFQNYQRRALQNEQEAVRQGAAKVVMSVAPVLDHFDVALSQTTGDEASRKIMDGVRVIRDELIKALERHGVVLIAPKPNDDFDPTRHQAVAQRPAEGVEPGRISHVMQAGYALDGRVIRSAMVSVAP
jgi:molecular chaperone GrpE